MKKKFFLVFFLLTFALLSQGFCQKGYLSASIKYPRPNDMTDEGWDLFATLIQQNLGPALANARTVNVFVQSTHFTVVYTNHPVPDYQQFANQLRSLYGQAPWQMVGPTFSNGRSEPAYEPPTYPEWKETWYEKVSNKVDGIFENVSDAIDQRIENYKGKLRRRLDPFAP